MKFRINGKQIVEKKFLNNEQQQKKNFNKISSLKLNSDQSHSKISTF